MSSHVWCHGPKCHTHVTTDRVRGSKGSKVLRTRKVKQYNGRYTTFYNWFCSQSCYVEFANAYAEQMVRIAPRLSPLETPVQVYKETDTDGFGQSYTRTRIEKETS